MRWLDGITDSMDVEFECTPGVGDEQGSLACCSPQDRQESVLLHPRETAYTALSLVPSRGSSPRHSAFNGENTSPGSKSG